MMIPTQITATMIGPNGEGISGSKYLITTHKIAMTIIAWMSSSFVNIAL